MRLLPASLALRLSLAFAALAAAVFAAFGVYLGQAADRHMAELDHHELLGKLSLARHLAAGAVNPEALRASLGDALVGHHGMYVAVDGAGGALFRWPEGKVADALPAVAAGVDDAPRLLEAAGRPVRAVGTAAETGWGERVRVVVARDISHHTEFLAQMQRDFWLAVVAAAVLTALVGVAVARHGMAPVRAMADQAGRISAGSLHERLPEAGVPAELRGLVQAFNAMLGRLEESFTRLSDFSADLAHELRTPIHSLRMQTEVSLAKARSVEEYRELLASGLEQYDTLARMIADMLFLAKADHGLVVPQRQPVPLLALGRQLAEYYGILAESIALTVAGEDIVVSGDKGMLQRALGNLLANALRHAPAGGWVRLEVAAGGGEARVTVANSGEPIPAAQLPRIFERFVRLDEGGEGSGLGLAIARSVVQAHGGRIELASDAASTRFSVILPLGTSYAVGSLRSQPRSAP